MKIFGFIMTFLVLTLSILPCCNMANIINPGKGKIELTKSLSQPCDEEQDECSPFCNCTCCIGFSMNDITHTIFNIPVISNIPGISFLPEQIIDITLPIWQPPRFC